MVHTILLESVYIIYDCIR